jgi:hypothetical protein
MTEHVIVLTSSGHLQIRQLTVTEEEGFDFRDLQKLVGGHFESVRPRGLNDPLIFLCNEEGMILELPINIAGTLFYGSPIVGDIAILAQGFRNDEPDYIGFDETTAKALAFEILAAHPWLQVDFDTETEGETT